MIMIWAIHKKWALAAVLLVLNCGGSKMRETRLSTTEARRDAVFALPDFDWQIREPNHFELSEEVAPTSYELELNLPAKGEFYSGTVRIAVDVKRPVSTIVLHASKLVINKARVIQRERDEIAGLEFKPRVEQIGLNVGSPLDQGPALLEIDFTGSPSQVGIFRRRGVYFTQFEPTYARWAFPCFDEPRFKTPWTVHITVDESMQAFANAPVTKSANVSEGTRFSFAKTRPLPTYLVALAAGPLISKPAANTRHKMRIIGRRSRQRGLERVSRLAPRILASVEDYLGLESPYVKQDIVAVPRFMFSGMENPGLITIDEGYLLSNVEYETDFQRLLAHEFAHLWFGDSVTMRWWNDVWLNESPAQWIAEKIVPAWWTILEHEFLLRLDAIPGSQPIEEPVRISALLRESWFSGDPQWALPLWKRRSSWTKGAMMMRMLESFIGEETMRQGLRHYLQKHADGVVTAKDFAVALSEGARRDLRPIIKSFVTQAGLPVISSKLECSDVKATLTLAQEPYTLVGEPKRQQLWHVPVCFTIDSDRKCFVLSEPKAIFELSRCPSKLRFADANGPYRYEMRRSTALDMSRNLDSYGEEQLAKLAYSLTASVRSGKYELPETLEILTFLAKSDNALVLRASLDGFQLIADLLPTASRPAFVRLVADTWPPVVSRLQPNADRLEDSSLVDDIFRFAAIEGQYGPFLEDARDVESETKTPAPSERELMREIRSYWQSIRGNSPITSDNVGTLLKMRPTRSRAFQWIAENSRSTQGSWSVLTGDDPLRFLDYVRVAGGVASEYGRGLCTEEEALRLEEFAAPHLREVNATDRAKSSMIVNLNVANIRRCARLAAHHKRARIAHVGAR